MHISHTLAEAVLKCQGFNNGFLSPDYRFWKFCLKRRQKRFWDLVESLGSLRQKKREVRSIMDSTIWRFCCHFALADVLPSDLQFGRGDCRSRVDTVR